MSLRLRELQPETEFIFISTPTGNEPSEVFEHLANVEKLLGQSINFIGWQGVLDGVDCLEKCIHKNKMIPNWRARFCTRQLKIEPTLDFLRRSSPCVHYVGLRADEPDRRGIYDDLDGVEHRFPMREWGWTIDDVRNYLKCRGVSVPRRTDCEWCFFQRLHEWKRLRKNNRRSYDRAVEIERQIGATFRSDRRDTWPAALEHLGEAFDTGRPVRGYSEETQLSLLDDVSCDREDLCRVCSM